MDYKSIEDLFKDTNKNPDLFMDYLVEYSDANSNYTCLKEYESIIMLFKDFALPLKHILAVIVLESIVNNKPSLAKKRLTLFKTKFKKEIEEEVRNMENIMHYLSEETEYGNPPQKKIVMVNWEKEFSINDNIWDKVREKLFPLELKRARDFVEIYKEALNDMIYITYKMGGRDKLVEYDSDENHNLADWVINNRKYDFLCGDYKNVDTLSFRMWEIIDKRSKQGLFD